MTSPYGSSLEHVLGFGNAEYLDPEELLSHYKLPLRIGKGSGNPYNGKP
jgi:hypothetical protein